MRKSALTNVPQKPDDRLPLNIRQAMFVVSAILRRIAAGELDMSGINANVGEVPELTEGKDEN